MTSRLILRTKRGYDGKMMLAPLPLLSGHIVQIPDGLAGTEATLRVMREMVNRCKVNTQIRQAATTVAFLQPEKDYRAEAEAVFNEVRDGIRYMRDVAGVETLQEPHITLASKLGDCDDKTCLLASMLESIGIPTRFVVAGYSGENFEHVYLQAWLGEWVNMDPTEPHPMGFAPPDPTMIAFEAV
jgi:transglutaminase-like putative cysteine protease